MSDVKHTPTPWKQVLLHPTHILGLGQRGDQSFVIGADPMFAKADSEAAKAMCEANAALIVRAVNCHADLVNALEAAEVALAELCIGQRPENECWVTLAKIRSALARAKGDAQ